MLNYDPDGYRHEMHAGLGGSPTTDYIIYYFHPESTENLEEPAKRNHSGSDSKFIGVGSFDEFVDAINSTPRNTDDIFIYLHSDANELSFYYKVEYVGRTIDPVRRQREHEKDPTKAHLKPLEVKFTGLTKNDARTVEQILISAYTLDNLLNAHREIAAKNWQLCKQCR